MPYDSSAYSVGISRFFKTDMRHGKNSGMVTVLAYSSAM